MSEAKIDRLIREAAAAAENAYCRYSGYQVGAALLAADGAVIRGCNVENASYGLTICAERNAISAAVAAGHRAFKAIAIVADAKPSARPIGKADSLPYPCGACLQVMSEFCSRDFRIYVARLDDLRSPKMLCLSNLLPESFVLR